MIKSTSLTTVSEIGNKLPVLSPYVSTALDSLNIFGEIAQSYARTLAYKAEIKRLDVELVNINKQAELMHKKIDSEYKIRIEELEKEKGQLMAFFSSLNHQIYNQHIEKMTLLKIAEKFQEEAFKTNDVNDRKMLLDMFQEAMSDTKELSQQSSILLDNLINKLPSSDYKKIGRS